MSGSRILVTTRKKPVATGMGSCQVFHLEELSDEGCWLILSQLAYMGKGNELREKLEDIGREIAKKCKGLPLAAKTLGGLLREKNTRNEWQNILNSEIWKLKVAEKGIFRPLLLSYYDLPSEIRPCLLYCAIFPKDFDFWPTELIKHWMAHGYLNCKENLGMEEGKGGEYFNYLASRSFFQDYEKDEDGNVIECKMHDMVHDFVQYLTDEEIVAVEFDNSETVRLDLSSKKTHHLRVKISKEDQFPVSIKGIENLRSLLAGGQQCDVTGEALAAFFKGAKCLRLFEFAKEWYGHVNVKEIPNEIGKLIHLRYLNFCGCGNLKELPEEVCELHNLQYLNLDGCHNLEKLPDGMGKLINLRYFYSKYCFGLQYYPKGIGRLTSLRELIPIRARVDGKDAAKEFSVGDLENLDLLRGYLQIKVVGNVVDVGEVKRAKLHNKRHLDRLDLTHGEINPNGVIQALNLPPSFDISIVEVLRWISFKRRST
ncbi:putative disease resistance protein RGA3 [Durio zibethinus]|uniref:Disease resistance protein RGA3 n=1 Tax=Durio zibethinus TaxID=66656 RepID=A0A6P6BB80_DURZI|nr:putative disease resistance protein RGA3 [Durio zibethinus]